MAGDWAAVPDRHTVGRNRVALTRLTVPLAYTPLIWPFVLSLATTVALGAYAYRRRHLPAAPTFTLLMAALSVWTFCYLMELSTTTLAAKQFWAAAKYFGGAPGPVMWFVLALHLTRNRQWLTPGLQLGLSAFCVTTIVVVFTNPAHHWFWKRVWIAAGHPETQASHGFFFWVYAAGLYLMIVTGVVLFIRYYRTTPPFYRRQAALLALGGFVPLSGRLLEDFFQVDLFPRVDNVILLFLASGVLFALAIFGFKALDIVHIGHNLVIRNMGAGIIVLDPQQRVVELNPYARALVGSGSADPVGAPIARVLEAWPALDAAGLGEHEVPVETADGTRWFQVQSSRIVAENGERAGYTLALFDVTARKEAERKLEALARTDPLTGASNRRHFREQAELELARAQRHGRPLSVLLMDLDHFKAINDTRGHQAGDEVLRRVAAEAQRLLRGTDLFGRYGGEEFVAVVSEGGVEQAGAAAERIRGVIADGPWRLDGREVAVTVSIGVACAPAGVPATLDELIRHADQALYAAKEGGRNTVRVVSLEAPAS
jgi:diguanylate cyclase (GGDEF)-like protein/PAS domain S-box-containing protein